MSEQRTYVTTPIYYVNDRPHIGHAYCSILADTYRRYCEFFGEETYFLTGTDEHGQKVQEAAEARGISPRAHVDELHQTFKNLLPEILAAPNDFIRTTEPRHVKVVQNALNALFEKGDIYLGTYEGWYSARAERFWTEKDLVDGKCPDSGGPVERVQEDNYFFRMSAYQDKLIEFMEANRDWVVPSSRWTEVRSFLKQPLEDLSISRPKARLSWGIPLPFNEDYVTYVWFDALLNYITAIGYGVDDEMFQRWWPASHHFIGKDILTTHTVYWGTMLMAMGLPLPKRICATGWWLIDNTKMSKSLGNVIDPLSLKDRYGPEVLRYFLMRDMVIGLDASFSEEALVRRNNSDLANDLGNLVRRALSLVERYFDGKIPEPGPAGDEDAPLQDLVNALPEIVITKVREFRLHESIEECMQVVRAMNRYIDHTAPYKVIKDDEARAGEILRNIVEGLHVVATLLKPLMPNRMDTLLGYLGVTNHVDQIQNLRFGLLKPGTVVNTGEVLFPKYVFERPEEEPEVEPQSKDKKTKEKSSSEEAPGEASFEDFLKLQIRTAKVLSAERIKGSEKLLKLLVDAGDTEPRTVVAGVAESYAPEDIPGKHIVIVANLKPRKIFGVLSQGMALLAAPEGKMSFIEPSGEVPPGTPIQ